MTSTDELRAKLDERGVEYRIDDAKTVRVTEWEFGEHSSAMFTEYDDGECVFVASGHTWTPEQAVAATVGRGNLTAEQVREAIMSADRWKKPMGDTGMTNTHLIIRDDGWQAIADELNATVGAGTCKLVIEKRRRHGPWIYHFGCGYDLWQPTDCLMPILKHCPNCGKRVEVVSE